MLNATRAVTLCLWQFLVMSSALAAEPAVTTDLGRGLYLFQYGSAQSIFVVGDSGVLATDPLSEKAARDYRDAIESVTNKPVKYVAYSSSFFDRVPGGRELADKGTRFVAQEGCLENLTATPHPDAVPPDLTYSDRLSLDVGGAGVDLYYFGQSYGTCLSVMIARPANIMFVHGLIAPPEARVPADPTLANYYLHNLLPFFVSVEELAAAEGVQQVVGFGGSGRCASPLAPVIAYY